MSKVPLRFIIVAGVLVAVNALGWVWVKYGSRPGQLPGLRILAALPTSDVDLTDRFALVFDEPLAPAKQIGQPLAQSPYVVQPAPPGKWTWAAADRLEYRLDKPLPPGHIFKLRPAPNLAVLLGRRIIGDSEFTFRTRGLDLLTAEADVGDADSINVVLKFNQPVAPAELAEFLRGHDGSVTKPPLNPQVLTQKPSEKLTVRFPRPDSGKLVLEFDPRLRGQQGEVELGAPLLRLVKADPKFACLRVDIDRIELDADVTVNLRISAELDGDQPPPKIKIDPPLPKSSVAIGHSYIEVTGPFACGQRYRLTVPADVRSADRRALGADQTLTCVIPDRQPSLAFPWSHGILSPQGNLNLVIQMANVPGLRLKAYRVHANNLVSHLHRNEADETARDLFEREFPLDLPRNQVATRTFDLRKLLDQPLGVYELQAHQLGSGWTEDTAVVAITDLALTTQQDRDGVVAWVTSLRTGQPVADATVSAFSANNQVLGAGVTNADGLVRLPIAANDPDGAPFAITAERGGDLTFITPKDSAWVFDDADQGGRDPVETYDVMLYAERGAYRPGETVHLTGLIRDAVGATPPAFPLKLHAYRPDGRQVVELLTTPDPQRQGFFQLDFPTEPVFQTGRYRFEATLPGGKDVLGKTTALVEAFVPARLEVTAEPTQPRFGPDDEPSVAVRARYLFGQPAAGLPVSLAGTLRLEAFPSRSFADYSFAPAAGTAECTIDDVDDKLDAGGAKTLALDPNYSVLGHWRGPISATVTEPGGRSVSHSCEVVADTAESYVGLRLGGGRVAPVGQPLDLSWVRVGDDDTKLAGGQVELRLERVEYDSTLTRVNDRWVWKSRERATLVQTQTVGSSAEQDGDEDGEDSDDAAGGAATTAPTTQPASDEMDSDSSDSDTDTDTDADTDETEDATSEDNEPAATQPTTTAPTTAPTATAPALVAFTCPTTGQYRLIAIDKTSGARTKLEFYAAPHGDLAPSVSLARPERLELVLDQEKYDAAATAQLLVRSPLAGTLLVTLETDRVLWQQVVPLPNRTATVAVPLDPRIRGGGWITASVVRPVDPNEEQWLPHRAAGLARVVVRPETHRLPLQIAAPDKAQPAGSVTVDLQTAAPGDPNLPVYVHLWAVDEGILQATAFKTPDPLSYYFAPLRRCVEAADIFGNLLPDHRRAQTVERIGGDGGEESLLTSPMPMRTRASAVIWQAVMPVDAAGHLQATLTLPELNGALRLMAVAADGNKYAAAEQRLTLAAPLIIEASWPRFAAPGDRFEVPIKLFNQTGAAQRLRISLNITGPLKVEVPADGLVAEVAPDKPTTLWVSASATAPGTVQVEAVATVEPATASGPASGEVATTQDVTPATSAAAPLRATQQAEFTVRPVAPLEHGAQFAQVPAGTAHDVALPPGYLPDGLKLALSVAPTPALELRPALDQLIEYPYGCVEQTTSTLIAMLHAPELLAADPQATTRAAATRDLIAAGIQRLWAMQTRSGGLAYWPGGREPTEWGSAYAGQFLVTAKAGGYDVPAPLLDGLRDFLTESLQNPGAAEDGTLTPGSRALLCRVLVGLGRPPYGWLTRLTEQAADLDMEGRAHLAAAWIALGRQDQARTVLADNTLGLQLTSTTGGQLTSPVRQQAVLLDALLDLDPQHAWVPQLVQRLSAARKDGTWGTTLDNAAAISALLRYQLKQPAAGQFTGEIETADGQKLAFESNHPANITLTAAALPAHVTSAGSGTLYVTSAWRGLRTAPPAPYDRQLVVRRTWHNRAGDEIDPNKLRVGDLVMVEVTLKAPTRGPHDAVENIVVVDALSAGVEVENPRLATSADVSGAAERQRRHVSGDEEAPEPDRVEFLDDRVLIFTSASSQTAHLYYPLRVISTGHFALPPIQAECMYDPGCASLAGGGTLEIKR